MAQLTLNDRILTLVDGAVTSSVDLSTIKGDDGPRGPQGPAGIITDGNTALDMNNYYDKEEVDTLISNVEVDLTGYATENYVNQQIAGIDMPTVPTNVSAFTNDAGYLTRTQILTDYYTKTQTDNKIASEIAKIDVGEKVDLSNYYTKAQTDALIPDTTGLATESFVTNKIAEAQLSGGEGGGSIDLSGYATKDDIPTKTSQLTNDSGFLTEQNLTNYATKDDLKDYREYNDFYFDEISVTDNSGNVMSVHPDGITGINSDLWIGTDGLGHFTSLYVIDNGVEKQVATEEYVTIAINNAIAALDGSEVEY